MNFKQETTAPNRIKLTIEISAEEFEPSIQAAYRTVVKRVNIPGFRKGKAPRKIVENFYGEAIFYEEAFNDAFPKAYDKAIEDLGLFPVEQPDIDVVAIGGKEPTIFTAEFFVKPEVTLGSYTGLEVAKPSYEVTDAQVDAEIQRDRERTSRWVEVEREAKLGDKTIIDYAGSVDGVAFDGGTADSFTLELGSGAFIPGFEEQIVGMEIGSEKDIDVTFPEDYRAEDLAGKAAVFHVKLHEIKEKQYPELDDEFAKDVSEFDTLDELRADIAKRFAESKAKKSESELENALLDLVIDEITGDIPPVMYEAKIDDIARDFSYRLQSQGMNLDMYLRYTGMDEAAFRDGFREAAEKQVKIRLALEAIAAKEELVPAADEVAAEYERLAGIYSVDVAKVKEQVPGKQIIADLACEKAVKLVRESAKVTEVPEKKDATVLGSLKGATSDSAKAEAVKLVADATGEPSKPKAKRTAKPKPDAKAGEEASAEEKAEAAPAKKPARKPVPKKPKEQPAPADAAKDTAE